MRYVFDFCVFGFPNATDIVGSSPCQTSRACGPIQKAMEDGNLVPGNFSTYGYCSAGGGIGSDDYARCLACVGASGDTTYVANALVALEAGCLQKPPAGKIIGLNDTVFSETVIGIVDPATLTQTPSSSSSGSSLGTAALVGIAIAIVLIIALIAGFVYIQLRKRRAARQRSSPTQPTAKTWIGHRPKSSLSFRCQTHLSPTSPRFSPTDSTIEEEMYSKEARSQITNENSVVRKTNRSSLASHASQGVSPVSRSSKQTWPTTNIGLAIKDNGVLTRLDTKLAPASVKTVSPVSTRAPSAVSSRAQTLPKTHSIRTNISGANSGYDPLSSATPTSSTQLIPPVTLPRYNPADFQQYTHPATSSPGTGFSPSSAGGSPAMRQHGWSPASPPSATTPSLGIGPQRGSSGGAVPLPLNFQPPPPPPPAGSRRPMTGGRTARREPERGSPVETRSVQVVFPGPPGRPAR
jgi:hypothetical protein